MKRLTCEMCGSVDLIKDGGVFVCQSCGCKYSVEEAKKMMVEGVVEVKGSVKVDNTEQIENMLVNARRAYKDSRYGEAQALYKEVLAADPDNTEAILYEGIAVGWQGNLVRYTMQQATDATLRALKIAGKKIEEPKELEKFVWKALLEITELGNAVASLCDKSLEESIKRLNQEFDSIKRYTDNAGLYADFDWVKQRTNNLQTTLSADEKKYGEIKDNTYLLVLSVYEEALSILKPADKYDVSTFNKIEQKLKENKIDKNAYYKFTVTKYKDVLNIIQNKKREKEKYIKKIEEERVKKYWDEHKEEKAKLDAELDDLIGKKGGLWKEISEFDSSIKSLERAMKKETLLEKELKSLDKEKSDLIARKSSLGLFKGKEKKELSEKIEAKEKEIQELSGKVKEEKEEIQRECDSRISNIKKEKQAVENQLKPIEKRIKKIQNVLRTAHIDSDIEATTDVLEGITESYVEDITEDFTESFTKSKLECFNDDELFMKYLEGESILTEEDAMTLKNEWLKSGRITSEEFAKLTHLEIECILADIFSHE